MTARYAFAIAAAIAMFGAIIHWVAPLMGPDWYAGLTELQVSQLLVNGDFVEICHDDKTEIQK